MRARLWTSLITAAAVLAFAACSRSPRQREARFMELGKRFLQRKDYARAGLEFRNAIQLAPADAEPYYQLGLTYLDAGNRTLAASCFRKAVQVNPRHAGAQLKLASMLAEVNDRAVAADAEKRAQAVAAEFPDNVDALNTLAKTELRLGKPEEAAEHLEQALKRLPGGLESSALLMRARLSQGDVKGAEAALQECFRRSPQSAEVALVMGRFYLVTHRTEEAEEQFRRAIRIDPKYGAALLDLGMLLFHAGRRTEAGPVFKQVAALPEKHYRPVYALFLLETGQGDAAVAELERLAKADPGDRAARTRLVKMYLIAGRRDDAGKLLASALARNPKDADALMQRSELALDAGRYQDAQNDLNMILRYRPEAAEPHVLLARLDEAQGRTLHERQELAEALRRDPTLLAARLSLARQLIASKGAEAALEILHQAPESQKRAVAWIVQSNWALIDLGRADEARKGVGEGLRLSRTPDLLLQDALLRMKGKDYRGARASLDEVLKQDPADVRALGALVQLYRLQNQPAAALRTARAYAAGHPAAAPVQNFLGELLLEAGKPAEARAAFTAAAKADSRFRPAQLALARLDVTEGKPEAARRTLSHMLAGNPNDPQLWLYMGWLENMEKNYPQALVYYRKVVDADPSNVVALNNLAYLLASQTGQFDEALKYAQQVKELAPDNKGVDDTIGWIMYRQGLYRSAVKYLESAAQGQADPVVRYHLGMAYLKLGDRRGEPALRAALKAAPDLPEARMAKQLLSEAAR
ncbi:MAG TPA: tetratricopeptide repeat protein [Bryobacteraceae bacterium]|nr:tetratricopeptide repeat protein [Bryobacteraceae bacterium]